MSVSKRIVKSADAFLMLLTGMLLEGHVFRAAKQQT